MVRNPKVQVHLEATNRRVDLVAERVDVAIRVRPLPLEDSDLVVRRLADRGVCFAASPSLVAHMGMPGAPADLANWPSLGWGTPQQTHRWDVFGPTGAQATLIHPPRYIPTDMIALRNAALGGVGVLWMPQLLMRDELADGSLVRLLPEWRSRREVIHAVYPSRRGLLPSVRALVDYLAERYAQLVED
jgi:DNA-binding transcriptional LysR family regulator